jgi:methionyl aminopeptidase
VFAHKLCLSRGAYPSPLNYHGFPKSVCTSVNNCACHGIPDDRSLKTGDMISVDITVYIGGVHGDCCQTFVVGGKVDEAGRSLVEVAERCLGAGLDSCGPGKKFSQIGVAIDKCARSAGFTVVPAFTGHGVGAYFHGPPDIYHVPNTYPGVMEPGMIFTVEPCITEGDREIEIQEDGWTANTVDNARAAQFEHTVLVVDDGIEVLTK